MIQYATSITSTTAIPILGDNEINSISYDCGDLICNRMGVTKGMLDNGIGPPAHFEKIEHLNHIPKKAVCFHRCKDGSLIDLLWNKK